MRLEQIYLLGGTEVLDAERILHQGQIMQKRPCAQIQVVPPSAKPPILGQVALGAAFGATTVLTVLIGPFQSFQRCVLLIFWSQLICYARRLAQTNIAMGEALKELGEATASKTQRSSNVALDSHATPMPEDGAPV